MVARPTPTTYIGPGKVREVGRLLRLAGVRKVLVIIDKFLYDSGLLDSMLSGIANEMIETAIFSGVTPAPTFDVVEEAQKHCFGCDAVVAVGGGSVLDTAKATAAAVSNNTTARKLAGLLKVRQQPLFSIAVPTTAGTGSETTIVAIISDPDTHVKLQLLDPKLVPTMAILDPELTVGLPSSGTAYTAFDALTHALEAYISMYADIDSRRRSRICDKEHIRKLA